MRSDEQSKREALQSRERALEAERVKRANDLRSVQGRLRDVRLALGRGDAWAR